MFGRQIARAGVTVPVEEGLSVGQLMELAQTANDGGCHTVLAGEVSGPDVFALLAAIAGVAPDVRLGTGIVPTTTRSLASLAMAFATLSSIAPGRILAGLGVSSRTVVEAWHGRAFPPPIAFMRELCPRSAPPSKASGSRSTPSFFTSTGFASRCDRRSPCP